MAISLLNNISSLEAQNQLQSTQSKLQNTLFQLSSGSRMKALPLPIAAYPTGFWPSCRWFQRSSAPVPKSLKRSSPDSTISKSA